VLATQPGIYSILRTDILTPAEWADGEAYYYGFKDIKTGKKTDKNKQMSKTTKIKNIKMIQ
jgi:hypothetical protein